MPEEQEESREEHLPAEEDESFDPLDFTAPPELSQKDAAFVYEGFSHHSGPLPAAAEFRQYDLVVPGSASRLLDMAEYNLVHSQQMDREMLALKREELSIQRASVEGGIKATTRGQNYGFIIALVVLLGGFGVTLAGHPDVGGVAIGIDLVAVVAVFITGRFSVHKSQAELPPSDTSAVETPPT